MARQAHEPPDVTTGGASVVTGAVVAGRRGAVVVGGSVAGGAVVVFSPSSLGAVVGGAVVVLVVDDEDDDEVVPVVDLGEVAAVEVWCGLCVCAARTPKPPVITKPPATVQRVSRLTRSKPASRWYGAKWRRAGSAGFSGRGAWPGMLIAPPCAP